MTISDTDAGADQRASAETRARSTEWGGPGGGRRHEFERHQRPALAKLQRDQDEMIADLREGFESLEEILSWAARANVRTLGKLDPQFYQQFVKRLDAQYLTGRQYSSRAVDTDTARTYRDQLAITVTSAADTAYREFRENVTEYVDDQTPEIEMFGGAVAFRPALTELEKRQKAALTDALTGFGSRQAIAEWERDLQAATFGEWVDASDYPIAKSRHSWAYGILQTDTGESHPGRYQYLLQEPLSSCIRGAREMGEKAQEAVENSSNGQDTLDA
ncbi:hypothetical protein C437_15421 [Haloarcula vallismortis ATCC 29715]|uniref:Uncharacterized protein n=1 Tax=Haloarcula vallismortis ATCC 29715 TaxID=662477 RepID=M0IY79_HALVA|nr:hypothetical protein [Haloarcula vallismortis]EMA01822.1 hypothetical protein C437_15421 [Haloarcula vallismortis ATCC 29715]